MLMIYLEIIYIIYDLWYTITIYGDHNNDYNNIPRDQLYMYHHNLWWSQ